MEYIILFLTFKKMALLSLNSKLIGMCQLTLYSISRKIPLDVKTNLKTSGTRKQGEEGEGEKKSVSTIASQEPMGLQKALAFWDAALISDPLYVFETASRGLHSEQQNSAVWVSRGSIDYCYWLAAMQLELHCRVFINVTSYIYLEKIVGRARLDHFWVLSFFSWDMGFDRFCALQRPEE